MTTPLFPRRELYEEPLRRIGFMMSEGYVAPIEYPECYLKEYGYPPSVACVSEHGVLCFMNSEIPLVITYQERIRNFLSDGMIVSD